MIKMTVNLTTEEVQKILVEVVKKQFPDYSPTNVIYKMTHAGNERNQPYGHRFTGVDIYLAGKK